MRVQTVIKRNMAIFGSHKIRQLAQAIRLFGHGEAFQPACTGKQVCNRFQAGAANGYAGLR